MRLRDLWFFVVLMFSGKMTTSLYPGSMAETAIGIIAVGWIGWMVYRVARGNSTPD